MCDGYAMLCCALFWWPHALARLLVLPEPRARSLLHAPGSMGARALARTPSMARRLAAVPSFFSTLVRMRSRATPASACPTIRPRLKRLKRAAEGCAMRARKMSDAEPALAPLSRPERLRQPRMTVLMVEHGAPDRQTCLKIRSTPHDT